MTKEKMMSKVAKVFSKKDLQPAEKKSDVVYDTGSAYSLSPLLSEMGYSLRSLATAPGAEPEFMLVNEKENSYKIISAAGMEQICRDVKATVLISIDKAIEHDLQEMAAFW